MCSRIILFSLTLGFLDCGGQTLSAKGDAGADGDVTFDTGTDSVQGADTSLPDAAPLHGSLQWVDVFNANEAYQLFSIRALIAVAADGTIAVGGNHLGPTQIGQALLPCVGECAFGAKLDADGRVIWALSYGTLAGGANVQAVATNATGDVYLGLRNVGSLVVDGIKLPNQTKNNDSSAVLKLAAADGKTRWAKSYGEYSDSVRVESIAVHGSTVEVSATFTGVPPIGPSGFWPTSQDEDVLLASHDDATGAFFTGYVYGGPGNDRFTTITIDALGTLHVAGVAGSKIAEFGLTNTDYVPNSPRDNLIGFAAKLQGFAKVWAANFGLGVVPRHLVVDSGGNLHLTGALTRNTNFNQAVPIVQAAGGGDMFIVKMHPNGLFQFAQSMGGTADALDGPPIAVGTGADIALAGTYNSSMMTLGTDPLPPVGKFGLRGIPSLFAARGDGAGSYPWMKTLSPKAMVGGFSGILVQSVGMDPRDQAVIIAGVFVGRVDFGDGVTHLSSHNGDAQSIFVLKLAP